jgi:hypothetical protein
VICADARSLWEESAEHEQDAQKKQVAVSFITWMLFSSTSFGLERIVLARWAATKKGFWYALCRASRLGLFFGAISSKMLCLCREKTHVLCEAHSKERFSVGLNARIER